MKLEDNSECYFGNVYYFYKKMCRNPVTSPQLFTVFKNIFTSLFSAFLFLILLRTWVALDTRADRKSEPSV